MASQSCLEQLVGFVERLNGDTAALQVSFSQSQLPSDYSHSHSPPLPRPWGLHRGWRIVKKT